MAVHADARGFVDQQALAMNVGCAAQPEADHARARGGVGEAVDQDERAGGAILLIGIKCHGHGGRQIAQPDLVQGKRLGGNVFQGVDVDLVLESGDARRHVLGADTHQV